MTDRRRLLQLAVATASTLWWPRAAWSQPRIRDNPFTMGVASGAPQPDSVVLWTRLQVPPGQGPVTVRWEIAEDEAFRQPLRQGQALAVEALAHSVHVEAAGLAPDRWYHYRFMIGGAGNEWVSPVGRTRTLPAPDAQVARLRLAWASCQRWEHGYFSAYRQMRADQPDLVLFLGDYIYEYPNATAAVRSPGGGWVITLDDYRRRYALYRSDADLQALHAACPWLMVWDDHEVQNDYAGLSAGNGGPAVADFAARRAAAYQAYYEHMPLPARALARALGGGAAPVDAPMLYQQLRYGRLATLNLLDARQYKDPQACTAGGRPGSSYIDPQECPAWADPSRSLLGATQEAWLAGALPGTGVTWSLIGQTTLFGPRDTRRGPQRFVWNDGWDGYPAARRRLTQMLHSRAVPHPVLFGGDVHENWVGHVKADYDDPRSKAVGVEFCGTSITSRSAGGNEKVAARLAENPHFVFADTERRGYGLAEFTAKRLHTMLQVVDDVTQPESSVSTLARFEVEAGRPVLERA